MSIPSPAITFENTENSYLHIAKDFDFLDSDMKLGQDDFTWKKIFETSYLMEQKQFVLFYTIWQSAQI